MDTGGKALARGDTYYGPNKTIDTTDYGTSVALEGMRACFKDIAPSNKTVLRTGGDVKAILARNVSGCTLLPGTAVRWQAAYQGRRFDGAVATTLEQVAGIIDPMLGSGGVRNGDMCWLIVEGKCLCKMPVAEVADTVVGDLMVVSAAAASTSSASTSTATTQTFGRIYPRGAAAAFTFSAAESTDGTAGAIMMNNIGRCLSAVSSSSTNTNVLVELSIKA